MAQAVPHKTYPRHLLGIPAEIRKIIYRHLLVRAQSDANTPIYPGILRVSRQIHGEAIDLWYKEHELQIIIEKDYPRPIVSELKKIPRTEPCGSAMAFAVGDHDSIHTMLRRTPLAIGRFQKIHLEVRRIDDHSHKAMHLQLAAVMANLSTGVTTHIRFDSRAWRNSSTLSPLEHYSVLLDTVMTLLMPPNPPFTWGNNRTPTMKETKKLYRNFHAWFSARREVLEIADMLRTAGINVYSNSRELAQIVAELNHLPKMRYDDADMLQNVKVLQKRLNGKELGVLIRNAERELRRQGLLAWYRVNRCLPDREWSLWMGEMLLSSALYTTYNRRVRRI